MVNHTQTIHQVLPTNCLSVIDYFVSLGLKGLRDATGTTQTEPYDLAAVVQ